VLRNGDVMRRSPRIGAWLPKRSLALMGVASLVLAVVAYRIHDGRPPSWDDPLLRFVAAHGRWQPLNGALTVLYRIVGEYQGLWFAGLLAAGLLVTRRVRAAAFLGLVLGSTLATAVLLKPAFHRQPLISGRDGYFPSTHAAGALVVGVTVSRLAWPTRRRWPVLAVSLATVALYGIALVFERSHYPSDVLAGWCVAVFWSYGFALLDKWLGQRAAEST
jgi:membrane-associated phospholipid phosphatase